MKQNKNSLASIKSDHNKKKKIFTFSKGENNVYISFYHCDDIEQTSNHISLKKLKMKNKNKYIAG
jgi:hypothetical protein